jgi:hypothetical protein
MQKPATVEIQWKGDVWRGAVVGGLGVLTSDDGDTYAGGVAGGAFDGRAVIARADGQFTRYCELSAGEFHGYSAADDDDGGVDYCLHERGEEVHRAHVSAGGNCFYDDEPCGADQACHVALKAAAQRVAVRPAPPSPRPLARHPTAAAGGVLRAACRAYACEHVPVRA